MKLILIILFSGSFALNGLAQKQPAPSDSILITIFLKHQQDKNLDSLRKIQAKNNVSSK